MSSKGIIVFQFSSVQFSHSVMSDSLRPHELKHDRPPCPSPTPRVHSNSHPSSRWCHPATSSSVVPVSCPQSFPASVFSNELALCITWPKYWSFSISASNEYSRLISLMIDWFDLLSVHGDSQGSFPAPQFKSISSSALSLLYGLTPTFVHDY